MATSGNYILTVTRDDIIAEALTIVGVLSEGYPTPNGYQSEKAQFKLNLITAQWAGLGDGARGMKLWKRTRADLLLSGTKSIYSIGPNAGSDQWAADLLTTTLSAAAAGGATSITVTTVTGIVSGAYIGVGLANGSLYWTTVSGAPAGNVVTLLAALPSAANSGGMIFSYTTLAQQPMQILAATLRDNTNTDTPLRMNALETYESLPTKANPNSGGDPTGIYFERGLGIGNATLYLDNYPIDLTKRVHLTFLVPSQTFVSGTDNPDYPAEWFRPLAYQLALDTGVTLGTPGEVMAGIKILRDESLALAQNQNAEETDYYFEPNREDGRFYR